MTYGRLMAAMISGAVAALSVQALAQEKKEQPAIKPAPAAESRPSEPSGPARTGPARKPDPTPEQFEAERQKYEKLAAAGEHHKVLLDLLGKWNLTVRYRMDDDTDWVQTTGKSEFRDIHEGRFLQEETTTDMTGLFGKPFNWIAIHGFDNLKSLHRVVFADNLGTKFDLGSGSCDPTGRVINYKLEEGKVKWILKIESKNRFVVQMVELDENGKEFNNMEIVGTR